MGRSSWMGSYKRIRRRREPPIQSLPCRTDRKGRFAGGGSHQFNHFHAELATGQICSRLTPLTAGKARNVSSGQIRLLIERATRFAGAGLCSCGFAGAQPRLAKIAQYIAIFPAFRLVAPYLSSAGGKGGFRRGNPPLLSRGGVPS